VARGHAIECRINAEDPRTFMPSPGVVQHYHAAGGAGVRMDSHLYSGYEIPSYYDSLVGKLIVHANDRPTAIARLRQALDETIIEGIRTNIPLHRDLILTDPAFCQQAMDIHYLEKTLLTRQS
jgi:acetyl-CoA carboxylase biotin carboxylase subunit